MSKDDRKRYSINFDLSIKALEEHYSAYYPKRAYKKIEKFFHKEGYIHVQGSGYHTIEPVERLTVIDNVSDLGKKYPWLKKTLKSIYLTEIGETYNVEYVLADRKLKHSYTDEEYKF